MSFIGVSNHDEEEDHGKGSGGSGGKLILFLLAVPFLPAFVIALAFYFGLLRWGRLRPSVSGAIVATVSIAAALWAATTGALGSFLGVFSDLPNFAENWQDLLPLAITVNIILGALGGMGIILWEIRQMKTSPHRVALPGSWMHNFEFRKTPGEVRKRQKAIYGLRSGELVEKNFAPLGLDEETEKVAGRYVEESLKHTLVVGAAGSGKALHEDTEILTPNGFSTVGKLNVGDMIYAPDGSLTEILEKHQPITETHFEVSFSNGDVVKACGDHQWGIIDFMNNERVVSTTELFKLHAKGFISHIRPLSAPLGAENNPAESIIVDQLLKELDRPESTLSAEAGTVSTFTADARREIIRAYLTKYATIWDGDFYLSEIRPHFDFMRTVITSMGYTVLRVNRPTVDKNSTRSWSIRIDEPILVDDSPSKSSHEEHIAKPRKQKLISVESIVPLYGEIAEAYYCFSVDHESHMFLVGRNLTPTHNTISMLSLMRADIEAGRTLMAVDFKRSPEFAAKLAAWAHEFGVEFYHFEKGAPEEYRTAFSKGQCSYDPFASGSAAEMIFGMREYDTAAAVYEEATQEALQVIFSMIREADRSKVPNVEWDSGGIYQFASAIQQANLVDLLNACEGKPVYRAASEFMAQATAKGLMKDTIEKLRGQMRTLVAGEYGRWFRKSYDVREINLLELLMSDKQSVILFSFNSEDEPKLSKYVGSMIFGDLRAVSAHIRNAKASRVVNVYVDEFQAVPPTAVNGLLEKARESKIAMTLAQQTFEQIITSAESNGEAYLQSILVTVSNFLIHAGMTQQSAERVSEILGKEWVTVYSQTNRSSGHFLSNNFSNRRDQIVNTSQQEKWRLEPSVFMGLQAPSKHNDFKSTAVLVNKTASEDSLAGQGTVARQLWMIPSNEVLSEYVEPQTTAAVGDDTSNTAEAAWLNKLEALGQDGISSAFSTQAPKPMDSLEPVSHSEFDEFISQNFEAEIQELDPFETVEDDDGDFGFEDLSNEPSSPAPMPFFSPAPEAVRPQRRTSNSDLGAFNSASRAAVPEARPKPQQRATPPVRPARNESPMPQPGMRPATDPQKPSGPINPITGQPIRRR